MEIQQFEYFENEKRFLDEIKNFFHNYLRAIIWRKKIKIADLNFKLTLSSVFDMAQFTIRYEVTGKRVNGGREYGLEILVRHELFK